MELKIKPIYLALITVLIAGLLNLFSKSLMEAGLSPLEVGAIREIGTALMFATILLIVDRGAFRIHVRDLPWFILFAFFNIVSNLAMFNAMDHIPIGMAAVLQMTSPYFVLLLSLMVFGIKITSNKIMACFVAFFGCMLIVGVFDGDGHICVEGVVCGVLSSITLAGFTIGGKFIGDRGYTENTAMMYFFGFSALMVLPLADYDKIFNVLTSDVMLIVDALCLCFICTLVVNFLIIYTTRRMDPGVFSIILSSSIIVSTIFGIVFFGETISFHGVIGIAFVLIAMMILESASLARSSLKTETGIAA